MENFKVYELVPKSIYEKEGDSAIRYITTAIQYSVDHIHFFFKRRFIGNVVVIINNWYYGGQFQYRGYRPPEYKLGALNSEHREGNAVDFDVLVNRVTVPSEDVRTLIIGHRDQFPFITRIELNTNWVHIDCKPLSLVLFKP